MSFSGAGTGIKNADDISFSSLVQDNILRYDNAQQKWSNSTMAGLAALPNHGGQEAVSTISSATGAVTLNLANGNVFNVTLTGNVTFTFSGATSGRACSFAVYIRQDSTGSRTVTWPSGVRWSGGAPTLTTTANAIDIVVFESIDGGTTWFGSLVGTNFV